MNNLFQFGYLLQIHGVNTARFGRNDRFCVRSRDAERIVFIAFLGQQGENWEIEATV